ncbi:MAG: histone deacetylase family protein, partial [Mesorhizobium sp.]
MNVCLWRLQNMVKAAGRAYIGGMVTRLYTHPIFLEHIT